jgi:hypothetical protein
MKIKYTFFILFAVVMSCSKSSTKTPETNGSIIGKWIPVAYLADPGDGSGTWQAVTEDTGYIIFNADSSASSNVNPYFGTLQAYHILSDSTLTYVYSDGTVFNHSFKLEGNSLTILGGCIEACGVKYKKVSAY